MSNAQTTVIRAKALISGADAPPVPNAVVVIEGDRIVAAGAEEAVDVPRGPDVRELDHRDGYLLPGLIDAHTHLMFGAGELDRQEREMVAAVAAAAQDCRY